MAEDDACRLKNEAQSTRARGYVKNKLHYPLSPLMLYCRGFDVGQRHNSGQCQASD